MPVYEFRCDSCDVAYEELVAADAPPPPCPRCGRPGHRLLSSISPPSRQPRGAKVRASESRRREREAARGERLAETAKKRARGELPSRRTGGDGGGDGGGTK